MEKWEARLAGWAIAFVIVFGIYQCEIEPFVRNLKTQMEKEN